MRCTVSPRCWERTGSRWSVSQHSKMPCMVWHSPRGFGPMPLHEEREARRLLQSARFRHGNLTRVGLSSDVDPKSPFDHMSYEINYNERLLIFPCICYTTTTVEHQPRGVNMVSAMTTVMTQVFFSDNDWPQVKYLCPRRRGVRLLSLSSFRDAYEPLSLNSATAGQKSVV